MMIKQVVTMLSVSALIAAFWGSGSICAEAGEVDCMDGRHQYAIIDEQAATETVNGYIVYECMLCRETYTRHTYRIAHRWSEWIVDKNPGCIEPGIRRRICTAGAIHSEIEEIPAAGHTYKETRVEPNCIEPGHKVFVCSACGERYTETFGEARGHSYEEKITKEADCQHAGIKTFTCSACGDSYDETVPVIAHSYGEWIVAKSSEEGVEGLRCRECEYCSRQVTEEIAALPITVEEPEVPFWGPVEIAVTAGNAAVWVVLFLLLAGEFRLIFWIRRQKKRALEEKRESEDYGYESL